ncbi:uncharacterized protein LOC125189978 [Salvia hispanica]|uniref:uncharacterized protein LOC125189978 n=1 Tax=Salvia hispanica TaxID=49212 RepID=UPI0020093B5E|nr:uncharacterized protein LOC125189978 [Salvia hispanica]
MSEGESPPLEPQTGVDTGAKCRGKKDPAWHYCTIDDSGGSKKIICDFSRMTIRGGGVHRMKEHLAGLSEIQNDKGKRVDNKRKKISSDIKDFMKPGAQIDASQPSIKACIQSKARWKETDMSLASWFYDACIPLNAVNSPHYQHAINMVASMGHGYIGPNYHALRVSLLKEAKFFVQNAGVSFIKSVDISGIEANAENLCNLFAEFVEIVEAENIVHMVTDNAPNYKNVGSLLNERYPTVTWSTCGAHCINLIMKDMTKLSMVHDLITLASRVTVFVYNHKWPLNWLRNRLGWTEIIRPGDTRFGTCFIALKSLHDHKEHLQALVTSSDFKKYLKVAKAKKVKQIVLDEQLWNNCLIISKIMGPIMRLLRICDSDEKPSLGYVYEGMWRVIKGVKELFKNKERLYGKFVDIIESRWDKMLRKNLHAAAFWLNPAFQYDPESPTSSSEVTRGLLDILDLMVPGAEDLMGEMNTFHERREDEWWRTFGFDAPNLQKVAVKLLSQTSSSSGCERNWNVFERIHTKKRNRLEHQRLNDLVFVHYNLRLKNHLGSKKRLYDPIDYECIDKVEFWVTDENPNEELVYEELEEILEEEQPKGNGDDVMRINDDEEVDLSRFDVIRITNDEEVDLPGFGDSDGATDGIRVGNESDGDD